MTAANDRVADIFPVSWKARAGKHGQLDVQAVGRGEREKITELRVVGGMLSRHKASDLGRELRVALILAPDP